MPLSKYDIEAEMATRPGASHALMLELVGANKTVLDVGCDTGYLGQNLIAMGNTVDGFEMDPITAAEAATHLRRVVVGDLEQFDLVAEFGRGSFDVVIFGDVLEHLRDPLPVLRQARPLLSAGGCVVISTPNIAHGDIRLALLHGKFNYTKVGILDETHTKFFTNASLVRFLHDAGFVLADLRRSRAPLFSTEVGVRESDFDPAVVRSLRADPETDTYQFVLSAVPDDSTSILSAQALRVDELATEIIGLRGQLSELGAATEVVRAEFAASEEQRDGLLAKLDTVKRAHDQAVDERDAALADADILRSQLERTQTGSVLRRVVSHLRG